MATYDWWVRVSIIFIYLGIPNRRLDLAQVQAQIPAFLAEVHADAEAQAQVQVSEVSGVSSNVNNVNSPVVS